MVDTSVWSLSLRRIPSALNEKERAIAAELRELISEGQAQLMGLVRQEILSGIRNPAQFDKLRLMLRAFPDVSVDAADHEAAARDSNFCKSKGITASVVDTLICAVARGRDWSLFTTDADFDRLARLLPVRIHTPRRL